MRTFAFTAALLAATAMSAVPAVAQELRIALSTHEDGLDPQDTTGNSGAPMLYQIY